VIDREGLRRGIVDICFGERRMGERAMGVLSMNPKDELEGSSELGKMGAR
jgi:hypothetical protein